MATPFNEKENRNALLLSQVLQDMESIAPEELPSLLGQVAALLGTLSAQLLTIPPSPKPIDDQLLTVSEAAQLLNTSPDWLYRNASKLPFAVRLAPKQLRFSSQGIARYLKRRKGRQS